MRVLALLAATLGSLTIGASANAEITPTDIQVAARALSFMEKPLTGSVRVGILYAPDSPRSVRQAESLQKMLGDGLHAGSLVLMPQLVKMPDAGAANVDMYFLTEFAGTVDSQTSGLANMKRRPCVTTDIEQVHSGSCLMGVRSSPKVEIVVNRAAAKDSGVTFATVFRVMITEM